VLTKGDPHSLGKWRVNGALPHIQAWYNAFNIGQDASLYIQPDKRVSIW
jgi:putative endopeptidase